MNELKKEFMRVLKLKGEVLFSKQKTSQHLSHEVVFYRMKTLHFYNALRGNLTVFETHVQKVNSRLE